MGQITEDFVQRAMRCCQLGQHPRLTVWETRQLLTAWVEWQGCRDERDKLDEANRICEQWRQWTVATRAENEALRARVSELEAAGRAVLNCNDQVCAFGHGGCPAQCRADEMLRKAIRCAGNKEESRNA